MQTNTGAFGQFTRNDAVNITTANGGTLTAPTNTGIVFTSGPDGTDLFQIAALATAAQTSANTIQFYTSYDFGTTFFALPLAAAYAAAAVVSAAVNVPMPNSVPMAPTNPLSLKGCPGPFNRTMSQSTLSDSVSWYRGAVPTGGTANVQTLALAFNSVGTQLSATPAIGTILDVIPGVSATAALTIAPGLQTAKSVVKPDLTAIATGDFNKGVPYRLVWDGTTNWILLPSQRLYAAMTQSQAMTITAWGMDR